MICRAHAAARQASATPAGSSQDDDSVLGDVDKPKLVFFFEEALLLFDTRSHREKELNARHHLK